MNPTEYIFVLGRNPELSLLEIKSVLQTRGISFRILDSDVHIARVEIEGDISIDEINKTLGGTVKIGRILASSPLPVNISQLGNALVNDDLFAQIFPDTTERINFGISVYTCNTSYADGKILSTRSIRTLIGVLKKEFDLRNIRSRFPRQDELALSSVSVVKNKLLSSGAEILLIITSKELLVGKTLAVQEFESFSNRDYGRPVRDMESGVMPPKLARMMINLAKQPTTASLLDPFCGSGTMLQEAILLGFRNIIGTDNSPKAISDTKANLEWLMKTQKLSDEKIIIELYDVTKLSNRFGKEKFDMVVTEPYLGPNLQHSLQQSEIIEIQKQLLALYKSAWEQFKIIVKNNGTVVMILPIFQVHRKRLTMDILKYIEQLGFTQRKLSDTSRCSIVVGNNYDFVLREIVQYDKNIL